MANQVVRLNYPAALLSVPIINQLIRQFEITVNILKAHIDTDQHWLEVQLAGDPAVLGEAIEWLKGQGVDIEVIDS